MKKLLTMLWLVYAIDVARGQGVEFFEAKIRPLLIEHCYECHGEKKQKGGLRLDSREGWMRGGDSGPAIEPGAPERSLLIKAVRYEDSELEMPPKNKLSAQQIADLEKWVRGGAVDPREKADAEVVAKPAAEHWAYQPVKKVAAPKLKNGEWALNDIDRFILGDLEAKGLAPRPDASREALVRRIYFDLVGLPPTAAEIQSFVEDKSAEAVPNLVKRLLDSPRFGERWARHWLDVARYAESVTLRGFVFKEAWRYRDYVIDAFNRDLPYDEFLKEQIAGDLMGGETIAERQRRVIATTFLMLGNTNLEEQDKKQLDMDFVDEQLDTIGKAFLGQTIGCARCHDHKFDPIPTRDYYAMAGILRGAKALEHANVSQWVERPLPVESEREAEFAASEKELAQLKEEIEKLKQRMKSSGANVEEKKPIAVSALPGVVIDDAQARRVGEWVHSAHEKNFVGDGYLHDGNTGKGAKTLTFHAEKLPAGKYDVRLAYTTGGNRSKRVGVAILHAEGETTVYINQTETPAIDGRFVSLGEFRFEANGQGYVLISNDETQGYVIADAVQFLPVELKQNLAAKNEDPAGANLKQLQARLKELTDQAPKRPMAMAPNEGEPKDIPVHIRGSVHTLGPVVPRGFLQVAMRDTAPKISEKESGRREMAEWFASPSNPLTARVMVNRVWGWLLGTGLVATPDNFGTTGAQPTNLELLDYLAARFVEEGWSVKKLVFEIATSRTYQQSTLRRLEVECMRDAILAVSGQLREEVGGATIKAGTAADYGYKQWDNRRAIYQPVFRNSLPEMFEVFDFPDPSMVVGQRNVSSVAQQSLFFLNDPWMREQSQHAAKRLLAMRNLTNEDRVERAYMMALGRAPSAKEKAVALKFVDVTTVGENVESERLETWTQLWQAIFSSVDFRYLN